MSKDSVTFDNLYCIATSLQCYIKCTTGRMVAVRIGRMVEEVPDTGWVEVVNRNIIVKAPPTITTVSAVRLSCPFPIITFQIINVIHFIEWVVS